MIKSKTNLSIVAEILLFEVKRGRIRKIKSLFRVVVIFERETDWRILIYLLLCHCKTFPLEYRVVWVDVAQSIQIHFWAQFQESVFEIRISYCRYCWKRGACGLFHKSYFFLFLFLFLFLFIFFYFFFIFTFFIYFIFYHYLRLYILYCRRLNWHQWNFHQPKRPKHRHCKSFSELLEWTKSHCCHYNFHTLPNSIHHRHPII